MLCLHAHAKINWTLDILGTREDGYHLMDMLMQTVSLHDTLYLEAANELVLEGAWEEPAAHDDRGEDALSAAAVPFDPSNLVYRAALMLRKYAGTQAGARMRLIKRIPAGAGMGGGSADAAAALKGLNVLWGLGLSQQELLSIGLELGADIPFLLTGGLARVGGIGEEIRPLTPAPECWLVLIKPCGGLSTREVFGAFDALDPATLLRPDQQGAQAALLQGDMPGLALCMANVLEGVSVASRPAIGHAARILEEAGALRGMMTGSGSVVYGVFADREAAQRAHAALLPQADALGWGRVWLAHTQADASRSA